MAVNRTARIAVEVENEILILIANIILLNDMNVIEFIYLGVFPSLKFELRYIVIVTDSQTYYGRRNHTSSSVCMI